MLPVPRNARPYGLKSYNDGTTKQKFLTVIQPFRRDTDIEKTDRQTDWQTDRNSISVLFIDLLTR